jgi:hypothetical protein
MIASWLGHDDVAEGLAGAVHGEATVFRVVRSRAGLSAGRTTGRGAATRDPIIGGIDDHSLISPQ